MSSGIAFPLQHCRTQFVLKTWWKAWWKTTHNYSWDMFRIALIV